MLILVGGLVVLIVILVIIIAIAGNKIKRYKNEINDEINDSNRAIDGWITNSEEYKKEIGEQREEIKNLHLENDAINEQRNVDKNTYQLEHNQIEKIRRILES